MIETYRRLKWERSAGEVEESGFTLIELLIVIVVLGILAAIVVFALGGVTGKSVVAACNSDSKTVDIAAQALQTENPAAVPTTSAGWKNGLLGNTLQGAPFLQSWPTSTAYAIAMAGSSAVADTPGDGITPNNGDVLVVVTSPAGTFDATQNPSGACTTA